MNAGLASEKSQVHRQSLRAKSRDVKGGGKRSHSALFPTEREGHKQIRNSHAVRVFSGVIFFCSVWWLFSFVIIFILSFCTIVCGAKKIRTNDRESL